MLNNRYMDMLKDKDKISYTLFMQNLPMVAFSSHQPVLIHTLNTIKKGNVIEFGTGYNSTAIMNLICGMQNRSLISFETDSNWFLKFRHYNGENHKVLFVKGDELLGWEFKSKLSVAFVDGAPAELRQPFIEKLKDIADYVIVHDSECVVQGVRNVYAYDFSMYKHVYHLTTSLPMTSLLSNLNKIDQKLLTIFENEK